MIIIIYGVKHEFCDRPIKTRDRLNYEILRVFIKQERFHEKKKDKQKKPYKFQYSKVEW